MTKKTVYYIEGDGIGPEVWKATLPVLNTAIEKAYGGANELDWQELLAGEKGFAETGEHLPKATMDALSKAELAMKGPLNTPVGEGFRSLNVTLRQVFDLYACIRPIKYFKGIESPVKRPDLVDMVVFRENTEDVYAGIEYQSGSSEAKKLIDFLVDELGANIDPTASVGIKPITPAGSKRLVKKALDFAIAENKPSVTLIHKGNIMKTTEGGFRAWGYELAEEEYKGKVVREGQDGPGVIIKDRIADAMFQNVLMYPEQYSVLATTNLNGDYISDALAAQVGGLGLAPGVNMGDTLAFFEATHGTAPTIAGKDLANPGSLILSGAMLLEHIGWHEAAALIHASVEKALAAKKVTVDLAAQINGATQVGCQEFGEILLANL
ncbi:MULTISPECIES: NADP-dependent isocitrate dehydrogenase [unclassified Pseudodesulfovibrio]|uniref:NADP-dependent isocitrate dehydrogenase n=1 Tax=unclassified Pseudodesulfovibrio TaxID=2661612 RepID=UPI000FEBB5DE|nr:MULTISPECIES: NADP-dependent isocitrate dehydrogenase [unclassified Pseudodesulfovibrio]MCJ2165800.1 NADP-dependent isocitrate dehydrogenase [Pseudodesulfovibrio sp. S3-i]RWU02764.1 NADP-dependent isocitrate dehydrogenase [Pseudodesulfovibrio sp. S3]